VNGRTRDDRILPLTRAVAERSRPVARVPHPLLLPAADNDSVDIQPSLTAKPGAI
jgi:hypothetical protein